MNNRENFQRKDWENSVYKQCEEEDSIDQEHEPSVPDSTESGIGFYRRKHPIGQKVFRLVDVYDVKSKILHGKVVKVYKREKSSCFDPKIHGIEVCHDVLWNDGKLEKGFFYHGITVEKEDDGE